MKTNREGFTLIELLVVVVIIGVLIAIAIPGLLNAIQRARQKRSVADLRSVGTAAEAYAVDRTRYPAAAGLVLPSGVSMPSAGDTIGAGTFINSVQPTYIRVLPLRDGWNSWFLYKTFNNEQDYIATSNGKNGVVDAFVGGPTSTFNMDIVFCDGQFYQWPEGPQK